MKMLRLFGVFILVSILVATLSVQGLVGLSLMYSKMQGCFGGGMGI